MQGRTIGSRNSRADRSTGLRSHNGDPARGYHFLHTAIDALTTGLQGTACRRAQEDRGRILDSRQLLVQLLRNHSPKCPDYNGFCYRSHAFRDALDGIEHRRTLPYRPQTNGKVERLHRTPADEWAYPRLYTSDAEYPLGGSTPTITIAATPHSEATHPPVAYPTSQVSTPRRPRPDRYLLLDESRSLRSVTYKMSEPLPDGRGGSHFCRADRI